MDTIFSMIGLIGAALFVIYVAKKVDDHFFDKRVGTELSDKIYQAAAAYSAGASPDSVRNILLDCLDLDEDDIDEILMLTSTHTSAGEQRYGEFVKAARGVLRSY